MAKEYIDKETLIKYLRDKQVALENIDCINMAKDIGRIIRHIEQDKIPAADVVEVVRCKDCKWCIKENFDGDILFGCDCGSGLNDVDPYGYCSYGDRK